MRTRNEPRGRNQSSRKQNTMKEIRESEKRSISGCNNDAGTLADISKEGVDKLLRRANRRGSSDKKKQDDCRQQCEPFSMPESSPRRNGQEAVDAVALEGEGCSGNAAGITQEVGVENLHDDDGEDMDESDWEDGSIYKLDSVDNSSDAQVKSLTIEFDEPPDSAKQKTIRRASAEEKELAELVHKVHLLCLLARGRLIDSACDDPLIQASLLSLLPTHLLKMSGVSKLTANALSRIVSWFHNNFHVRSLVHSERPFHSALAFALETREGTPEEIAALSVALFRALKFTTRFVSILDVASLKPEAEKYESCSQDTRRVGRGVFRNSTLMVANPKEVSASATTVKSCNEKDNDCETSLRASCKSKGGHRTSNCIQSEASIVIDELNDKGMDSLACEGQFEAFSKKSPGMKRKGDLEFEMQMAMALSATAVGTRESNMGSGMEVLNGNNSLEVSTPLKRIKRIQTASPTSNQGFSTAIGSRKVGSPLFWAEVYCSGENLAGKWVHVDAVNAIIDGEQKVEAAAAACKTSVRYVVAFAGGGAKDVTRRYCMTWYKIASKRVNSIWWNEVLAPLVQLESGATGDVVNLEKHHDDASKEHEKAKASRMSEGLEMSEEHGKGAEVESSSGNSFVATRNSLEDMEFETRALTEPLPTNQQAYKNHKLYALERWLTKYQILQPRGPILGYCSGHPVYPRSCVQTLKPKERWLREGLQVKANEVPAKILKRSAKLKKASEDDDYAEVDSKGNIELYGRWQLEPLCLPHAVNGIVPKNDRGQVEVWSEKCLPPGTVHLRLPRIFAVAKRLEIDYAPAMVGFEFRNGRCAPVFDGIVVCAEFKDVILEAYAEEEERRQAAEKKKNESLAISRWYQLLSSIVTRQKLNNHYGEGFSSLASGNFQDTSNVVNAPVKSSQIDSRQSIECEQVVTGVVASNAPAMSLEESHEHVFVTENQNHDEDSSIQIKRCHCGFSIQVEEL